MCGLKKCKAEYANESVNPGYSERSEKSFFSLER